MRVVLTPPRVSDVLLLEQGQLTGGTTWHAAGLVSQLKSTHSLTKLATYSTRLFEELEDETGQATGYRSPGSISVASIIELILDISLCMYETLKKLIE